MVAPPQPWTLFVSICALYLFSLCSIGQMCPMVIASLLYAMSAYKKFHGNDLLLDREENWVVHRVYIGRRNGWEGDLWHCGGDFSNYIVILCNTENLRAIKKTKQERETHTETDRHRQTWDLLGVLGVWFSCRHPLMNSVFCRVNHRISWNGGAENQAQQE